LGSDEGSRYSNKLFSSVFFRPQSPILVAQLQCGPSREMFASAISNVRIEQDHHILDILLMDEVEEMGHLLRLWRPCVVFSVT
jgi:hypothetical protein